MNKLTEIQQRVKSFNDDPNLYGVVMTVQEMNYLISLLEEKNKDLAIATDSLLSIYDNSEDIGSRREAWNAFNIINTSSNNEGETI